MDKKSLRKALLTKRNLIKDKDKKDLSIYLSVIQYIDKDILIYFSKKNEIDTTGIIQFAFDFGYRVYIPKVENQSMTFYEITSFDDVTLGKYNIMEPTSNITPSDIDNTICITPGIAYDKNHNRLGYGGGFYDRFLANYHGKTIGLCYDELLEDSIPTEETDIPVDMIITNKKILMKESSRQEMHR